MENGRLSLADVEKLLMPGPNEYHLFPKECVVPGQTSLRRTFRIGHQEFDVTFHVEPWAGMMRSREVTAQPLHVYPPLAPEPEDPAGPKAKAATEAIAALWPAGIPAGLMAKDRENQIVAWCEQHGRSVPSVRTVQLALKARTA